MKLLISVIGASGSNTVLSEKALISAYEVGKLIASRDGVLICGGKSGIMEAVSRGAKEAKGITVGILPGLDKIDANPYIDIPLTTGIGFTARNVLTIRVADAVIMISGGIGTLNELTIALDERIIPVVIVEGTGGWSDRIRGITYKDKFLDEKLQTPIYFVKTPKDAVDLAFKLGENRHKSIKENIKI